MKAKRIKVKKSSNSQGGSNFRSKARLLYSGCWHGCDFFDINFLFCLNIFHKNKTMKWLNDLPDRIYQKVSKNDQLSQMRNDFGVQVTNDPVPDPGIQFIQSGLDELKSYIAPSSFIVWASPFSALWLMMSSHFECTHWIINVSSYINTPAPPASASSSNGWLLPKLVHSGSVWGSSLDTRSSSRSPQQDSEALKMLRTILTPGISRLWMNLGWFIVTLRSVVSPAMTAHWWVGSDRDDDKGNSNH